MRADLAIQLMGKDPGGLEEEMSRAPRSCPNNYKI